jgi:tetratricopeptide (TPR) repeat protein
LLDDARHAPAEYHDGLTVAKTFALAIEEAAKLHPAAEPLIVHAALLAPEPIPLFLFADAREKFGEPLASALEGDGLDEAVAALRTFALIDRETIADEREPAITTDTIRLHRLVREVAAARCEGEAREAARRALIEAMAAVYPEGVFNDPKSWPRARRLDSLTLALVSGDVALMGAEALANLLDRLAYYRYAGLGTYTQARPLIERTLEIREKALGPEHPDTAGSLNNLAELLKDQGDLAGARPLLERALAIREKALGPEHPYTNASRANFAWLMLDSGNPGEALSFGGAALAADEKLLGQDHPGTKCSARVTADALDALGRADEAAALRARYGLERKAPPSE